MEGRVLKIYLSTRHIFRYAIGLFVLIALYRLLSIHVLAQYFASAFTLTMLFIPVFCYFLQRKLMLTSEKKRNHLELILYSMLMIWITASLMGLLNYLAASLGLNWFFSSDADKTIPAIGLFKTLKNYLYWYTIFGLPSSILARLVLLFKK